MVLLTADRMFEKYSSRDSLGAETFSPRNCISLLEVDRPQSGSPVRSDDRRDPPFQDLLAMSVSRNVNSR